MEAFKAGFARNYDLASRKFQTAIDEIDKTILHLQKTKDALMSSENNLRLANNKAQDLTIKRLTQEQPHHEGRLRSIEGRAGRILARAVRHSFGRCTRSRDLVCRALFDDPSLLRNVDPSQAIDR